MNGRRQSKKNRREAFVRTSAQRAADKAGKESWMDRFGDKCPNGCGEKGPHFVPPGFGDPGFFICTKKEPSEEVL